MTSALLLLFSGLAAGGLPSWGLTIIVFTIIVKIITMPLTIQQMRSAKAMQALQPELEALKKQYGKDREKLMQAQMELYRERGVNPMAGCLPMLIQMPIWIGLYTALFHLSERPDFASNFLWMTSLAQPDPLYILAALSGITGFLAQKVMVTPSTDPQQQQMQAMMQFMPIMYVIFAMQVPAGLVLYWIANNVFTFVQQGTMMGWKNVHWGLIPFSTEAAAMRRANEGKASNSTPTRRDLVAAKSNGRGDEAALSATSLAESTASERPTTTRRKRRRK